MPLKQTSFASDPVVVASVVLNHGLAIFVDHMNIGRFLAFVSTMGHAYGKDVTLQEAYFYVNLYRDRLRFLRRVIRTTFYSLIPFGQDYLKDEGSVTSYNVRFLGRVQNVTASGSVFGLDRSIFVDRNVLIGERTTWEYTVGIRFRSLRRVILKDLSSFRATALRDVTRNRDENFSSSGYSDLNFLQLVAIGELFYSHVDTERWSLRKSETILSYLGYFVRIVAFSYGESTLRGSILEDLFRNGHTYQHFSVSVYERNVDVFRAYCRILRI